ncbi:MAG: alcohol dehydrogenase catalytic domain-containing protein [Polyangiaceae bacterium]
MMELPKYYRDEDAAALYVERADEVISAATRVAAERQVTAAADDRMRVCVFGIDPQVGFCLPGASLFVPGAVEDLQRTLGFIYRNADRITSLILSQDTHGLRHVFFPHWWRDDQGRAPAPFTVIRAADVRAGRFAACHEPEVSLAYLDALEAGGRFALTIWPYHTLAGGPSHALAPALLEAALYHGTLRNTEPRLVQKGRAALTENYSVLSPEVIALRDRVLGRFDEELLDALLSHDRIYVFGQAKSHCVLSTLRDLAQRLTELDPSALGKFHILVDGMSPVPAPPLDPLPPDLDFPRVADEGLRQLAEMGMHLVRCDHVIQGARPQRDVAPRANGGNQQQNRTASPAPGTMRAVLREGAATTLATVPIPEPKADEVLLRVAYAGVCRTDLAIARGALAAETPLILGHEVSGIVAAQGPNVTRTLIGQRVTLDPRLPCGACPACVDGNPCVQPGFLGRHRHGAFAEWVTVPECNVLPLPASLGLRLGAYAEPVAAALAVAECLAVRPPRHGLVLGRSRFSKLVVALAQSRGLALRQWPAELGPPAANSADAVVETNDPAAPVAWALQALHAGGVLVVRSRGTEITLPTDTLLQKNLRVVAANYGSFSDAVTVLSERSHELEALLGDEYTLDEFEACFERASRDENEKILFRVGGEG